MRSTAGWICFFLLLTSIVGCKPSGLLGLTLPDANLTGTWNVTLTVTGGVQAPVGTQLTATFTIAQTGSTITGTFSTGGGFSGSLSGTISVQTFSLTITQGAPCPGTFTGAGTAKNALGGSSGVTQMTGSYSGSDCNGTLAVDFVATRSGSRDGVVFGLVSSVLNRNIKTTSGALGFGEQADENTD